jgi:hypothetical protein
MSLLGYNFRSFAPALALRYTQTVTKVLLHNEVSERSGN